MLHPVNLYPVSAFEQMLQYHFMQNAVLAGTVVAVVGGLVGYFIVLRGQSFAAHALSQVGFPGAAAGVLIQVSPVAGLLVFCVAAAIGIGVFGRRLDSGRRVESAAIGTILTFALGLGLLFAQLFRGSTPQGTYGFLFGSILGVGDRDVVLVLGAGALTVVAMAVIGRPLLFASVDADSAEARGVPVRLLSMGFLLLVALSVALSVQIVGTLLVFALLVTPGATAQRLTPRPGLGIVLSVVLSLLITWAGLTIAYFTNLPVGFFITSLGFGSYLVVRAVRWAVPLIGGRALLVEARA
jgi:zinc/manganese transport system permease protein